MLRILFIISIVISSCKEKSYLRIEDEKESGSMVSLRNFTRTSYKEDGSKEWNLEGKESYIYPKENRTIVYGIEFLQFEKGSYSSRLKSDRGEINHQTKAVVLEGSVFLETNEKRTLETEKLNYDLDAKTLVSESDVIVKSEGTTIRGKGLRADKELNKYTILHPTGISVGGSNPFKEK